MKIAKLSSIGALCLLLVGCSLAQFVNYLSIAAADADKYAPLLASAPLPAGVLADILAGVNALDCAAATAGTGGTSAEVTLAIAACGLKPIAATLPSGTAQNVVTAVSTLTTDIANVLANYPPTPAAAAKMAATAPTTINVGWEGHRKLASARKHLASAKAVLTPKVK